MFTHKFQTKTTVLLCLVGLGQSASVLAKPLNSTTKPELPKLQLVSPSNVYGNAHTQLVEKKLIALMQQAPRLPKGFTSEAKAKRIYNEVNRLVSTVTGGEELEKLAYWSNWMIDRNLQISDLGITFSAFEKSLFEIKRQCSPIEARAFIYEIASLVNADGHSGEEIELCITESSSVQPIWSPTCCYVFLRNAQSNYRENPNDMSTVFNITRLLRNHWYKNWTGKYRYTVKCSFDLLPDKSIRQLEFDRTPFKTPGTEGLQENSAKIVRSILTNPATFKILPGPQKALKLDVVFFD